LSKRVLIIAEEPDTCLSFLGRALPAALVIDVLVATQLVAVRRELARTTYDLILIGDRVADADPYDVALHIKGSKRNRGTPVVCTGFHVGRAAKVLKLLKPFAFHSPPADTDVIAGKVKERLSQGV